MIDLFGLQLKAAALRCPLLIFLVVCQLVLGQMSANALSARAPQFRLAVMNGAEAVSGETSGELADAYVKSLQQSPELEIILVDASDSSDKVFRENDVQGLAVLDPDFDNIVRTGESDAVKLYPAPGITDVTILTEYLSSAVVIQIANLMLEEQLVKDGIAPGSVTKAVKNAEPILVLDYNSPEDAGLPLSAPPVYGVPALFLLLAFLHAAFIVPGRDTKRACLGDGRRLRRAFLSAQLVVWLTWITVTLLYLGGMWLFYHTAPRLSVFIALAGLAVFASSLGGLVAMTGKRTAAVWIFVPWLLLNMTLGGGLWTSAPMPAPLQILLPVSLMAKSASGAWVAAVPLYAGAVICFILCLVLCLVLTRLTVPSDVRALSNRHFSQNRPL
jgi:hypothetical protein